MKHIFLKFGLFFIAMGHSESANILIVIPYAVQSHYIMQRPIGLELARRGHNVTVITPYNETDVPPTYHQIKVSDKKIWEVLGSERPNLFTMVEMSMAEFHHDVLGKGGLALTEMTLRNNVVQEFLSLNQTFDVVISEQFYQDATYILAHKYNAPLILMSSLGNVVKHNIATRNPLQLATLNYEIFMIEDPTRFLGRMKTLYISLYDYFWWRYWFLKEHEKLIQKYIPNLPEPVPSLYQMQKNVALFLMNTHFSYDPPAAYLPNIVEIGGIHLSDNVSQLPSDLQKLLDEAEHGVVYVNFGSNIQSAELPEDKKNAFVNVFERLNHTVIWKWEDDNFVNKPKNVVTRKWLPQNEILSHPNVKVFISHGGLIGTLEAVYRGVPIIGIPIYGDQYNNLLQVECAGSGSILQYHNINEINLETALHEFLKDDSYRKKAKELSVRFKDRPMKALDTAVFWIEYVIRNKGANYMKNPALKLSWIAYNMLDVYAFILFVIILFFYLLFKTVKIVRPYKNVIIRFWKTNKLWDSGKLKCQ